jgi:eukaryotic-like serine/threonine-protein kinase
VTPQQWARIKDVFHAALEVPPHDRDEFLNERCVSDPGLAGVRSEVERLLAAHDSAASFIELSPVAAATGQSASRPAHPSMTGRLIGRYQIGRRIGSGGMGEVYLARDQELGRDVAFKIAIEADPESQLRLRSEAQHASRLNHPHICTIHEVGSIEGQPFIVMELVEGPTLAQRIADGPIPLDEALILARQIADALDQAHAQGVIHRDLKPANVKVRPDRTVKILDFGLAKAAPQTAAVPPVASASTTVATPPPTRPGMILGTPAYMAPEQLRGKPADRRADIWAFGCVLFEMVTGQRAFGGETVSETVAAVLTADPAWDRVPTPVRRLLHRCLERDPTQRLRDIGDAMALVDEAAPDALVTAPVRSGRERWAWSAAAVLLTTTIVALGLHFRSTGPAAAPQVRFEIQPPDDQDFVPFAFAPAPDGRSLAFLADATGSDRRGLWVYSIASGVSREVTTVESTSRNAPPFWSPDGRSIGLYAGSKILRVDVASGAVQTVCDVPDGLLGFGSWSRDQVIVFAVVTSEGNDGLMKVPASGGTPVRLTHTNRSRQELGHTNPVFLHDGHSFLYQAVTAEGPRSLYLGSVDARPEEQSAKEVLSIVGQLVHYSPSPDPERGYALFMQEGKLMAQAFDNRRQTVVDSARPVPGQISKEITSRDFAASADVLMYRRLSRPTGAPVWVDRRGREDDVLGGALLEGPEFPRLSPDGRRLALTVNGDIWVYDLVGRPPIKLTFDGTSFAPLWTADGRRLIYESPSLLNSIASDGSERASRPASSNGHYHPHGWSPDGKGLIVVQFIGPLSSILTIPVDGKGEPESIVQATRGGVDGPALSPDGRWLAYSSATTGRREIWVQPFPTGPPVRVSPNGGVEPVWARSGRELFYLEGRKMMSVVIDTASGFDVQAPVVLFEGTYLKPDQPPSYDVSPDGRFLMIKPSGQMPVPITAILNWTEALKAAGSAP